jgi:hypothetical protein
MNIIRLLVKRHPLIAFFMIAYSFTWLGWLLYGPTIMRKPVAQAEAAPVGQPLAVK